MALARYRQAVFVEGVRVPAPEIIGPVAVYPLTGVALGRDVPAMLNSVLRQYGFVTVLPHAATMVGIAGPRPLSLLALVGEMDKAADVRQMFSRQTTAVRNVLTLRYGGETRLLASVLEHETADRSWAGLALEHGGPGWQRTEFRALAPDDYRPPEPSSAELFDAFTHRPLPALWCQLFISSLAETRWDVRVFRLWAVLETIARRVVPKGQPVTGPDGQALWERDAKPATTDTARGRVYVLLRLAHTALAVPIGIAVTHPDHDLWSEVEVWYSVRNAVAHGGAWRIAPESERSERDRRVLARMDHAARPGGTVEEGMTRYVQHLQANVEAVVLAALLGSFDAVAGVQPE